MFFQTLYGRFKWWIWPSLVTGKCTLNRHILLRSTVILCWYVLISNNAWIPAMHWITQGPNLKKNLLHKQNVLLVHPEVRETRTVSIIQNKTRMHWCDDQNSTTRRFLWIYFWESESMWKHESAKNPKWTRSTDVLFLCQKLCLGRSSFSLKNLKLISYDS